MGRLPPSTLLLDLGGVLVEFDFTRVGTRISRITGLEFEAVREAFRADGLAARYESGLLSDADFHAQICRRLGREIAWSDFADAWNSIFLRLPLVPEEVVAELASRAGLWLVSNTNRLHFDFVRERFPLLRHFSGYVLSHGEIVLHRPAAELRRNQELLVASYLGEARASRATSVAAPEHPAEGA